MTFEDDTVKVLYLTGKEDGVEEYKHKVIDAWTKFKRELQYDGRSFACAKEIIDFETELSLNASKSI